MKLHWQVGGYVLGTKLLPLKLVTLVPPRVNPSIPGIYEATSANRLRAQLCGLRLWLNFFSRLW